MKKVLINLLLCSSISLFASSWQAGWAMGGTSTYSLLNEKNKQLLIECSDMRKDLYVYDSNGNKVDFTTSSVAGTINNVPSETITEITLDTISEGKVLWNNYIRIIPYALDITFITSNQEYKFKTNNSHEIIDILESCLVN